MVNRTELDVQIQWEELGGCNHKEDIQQQLNQKAEGERQDVRGRDENGQKMITRSQEEWEHCLKKMYQTIHL